MRLPPRTAPAARGFSIVETVVALAILTIGIFAIYGNFMQAHDRSAQSEVAVQARLLAHQELERLRACPREGLLAAPAFTAQGMTGHQRFFYRPAIQARPDGTIDITVQVGWDTPLTGGFKEGKSVTVKGVQAP